MKSRICMLVVLWLGLMPLSMSAQDDMYFIPKKKTQSETTVKKQNQEETDRSGKEAVTETIFVKKAPVYTFTYVDEVPGDERDVDEYNRRYRFEDIADDSLYTADEDTSLSEDDGEWVGGFDGSDEDYEYTKRILVFQSPTVGVPVSSPLYWDLCYGPNSIYWNVYDDGFYAYIFPTAWNPYYYSPWRTGFWWDFHFGYPYWGWGGGFYWGWHHPFYHHWPYYAGTYYRPHPSYRVNRPSLGRSGVVRRTVSGRPVQGTSVRGTGTSRTGVARGARVGGTNQGSQSTNRGSRIVIPRRSTESSVERTTTNSRPVIERSTPSRIGSGSRIGGGFGGGSRGGGVSRSGVSRGAR